MCVRERDREEAIHVDDRERNRERKIIKEID